MFTETVGSGNNNNGERQLKNDDSPDKRVSRKYTFLSKAGFYSRIIREKKLCRKFFVWQQKYLV